MKAEEIERAARAAWDEACDRAEEAGKVWQAGDPYCPRCGNPGATVLTDDQVRGAEAWADDMAGHFACPVHGPVGYGHYPCRAQAAKEGR